MSAPGSSYRTVPSVQSLTAIMTMAGEARRHSTGCLARTVPLAVRASLAFPSGRLKWRLPMSEWHAAMAAAMAR